MTLKILVTGGTGLVGCGIKYALQQEKPNDAEEWIFVGSKDADLTKYEEVDNLFKKYKPDYVIHLASVVGGLYTNMSQNLNFFTINTFIHMNVLNCCHLNNVKKVFSCLSSCVFDINEKLPYSEKSSTNGNLHDTNIGYALSKRIIIDLNKLLNKESSCKFMSFIPCNIFGPNDKIGTHFVPSLVKRLYESECEKKPLIIYGDGKARRQIIYSHDLGKLIILLIRHYNDLETIILSPDENEDYQISEIVRKTASVFNFSQPIVYDKNKNNGVLLRTVTNKKLQNFIRSIKSNFEFTPYDVAISNTMDWFVNENFKQKNN